MRTRATAILCLVVLTAQLTAQTDTRHGASPQSGIVARAGGYQLTERMIEQAIRFGEILAGSDFSLSDAARLRSDLIAYFQREPSKQTEAYQSLAKALPGTPGRKPSWLDLALVRYKVWQGYAQNQQDFRSFQSYPFGKMVLKYNPALANSGGMIVTKTDVDCQFYADTVVAKAAGVAPPTETDKDRFVRSLASEFASWSRQQQEYMARAELRLVNLLQVHDGTIKTRAIVDADIRKNVHSSGAVWREARQVENDAEFGARYYQLYRAEALNAIGYANRVNLDVMGLGRAGRSTAKSADINTPMGQH
jgi:hypothetical protein